MSQPYSTYTKDFFKMTTDYEWGVEEKDEYGDIAENHFCSSYAEAVEVAKDFDHCDIVLVRTRGSEADGVTDRQWAYVEDGKLSTYFSEGAKVPVKFHKLVAAAK